MNGKDDKIIKIDKVVFNVEDFIKAVEESKKADIIFFKANLKYSKLTNAWVSFVVGSSLLLKEIGK